MQNSSLPAWLSQSVIYQIYPQSFQDSNGDGIGDLPGLISRLDYIQSLGANTLWLNPIFDSPFGDAGYDIRDFYKLAPRYGSEADLIGLFDEAHARGMKVLLDLVAGHTSMDHPWFVQEATQPMNPESNRYIWKNREFDLEAGPDRKDFLSNFFWYQPALNYGWEKPQEPWQDSVDAPGPRKNKAELKRIMAYWFERGCDGFRVDMAASLVKDGCNPNVQGAPGTLALWEDLRGWMDHNWPDCVLTAEWSYPSVAVPAGFHLDYLIHFNAPGYKSLFFNGTGTLPASEGPCYFDKEGKGSLEIFKKSIAEQLAATRGIGYISMPTANHDFQRPRCGPRGWEGLRPIWVFLMTQPGIPTIYYGDEIGMRFVTDTAPTEGSTLEGVNAPNAGAPDGERAGTRTPMQWEEGKNAGFSSAHPDTFYLPLDPDASRPSVASQEADPDSLLHFVRQLIGLRAAHPALGADGDYEILNSVDQPYPLMVKRAEYLVVINPTKVVREIRVEDSSGYSQVLINEGYSRLGNLIQTAPFAYAILKK